MKNILPIYYPIITSLPNTACLVSILSPREKFNAWFANNFIQFAGWNPNSPYIDYYQPQSKRIFNQLILTQYLKRETINRWCPDIIQCIIDSIDMGNFVYLYVDTYHISAHSNYNTTHRSHEILVYGYDIEEKLFYVADFFKLGRYEFSKTSFLEFEQAYKNPYAEKRYYNGIQLLQYDEKAEYSFDISHVIEMLESFLDGKNISKNYKLVDEPWGNFTPDGHKRFWGVSVYDMLEEHLIMCIINQAAPSGRSFHFIWDHKVAMLERIKYLIENEYIKRDNISNDFFKDIEQSALILRNFILKYNISNQSSLLERGIEVLRSTKKKEQNAIQDLINQLKKSFQ